MSSSLRCLTTHPWLRRTLLSPDTVSWRVTRRSEKEKPRRSSWPVAGRGAVQAPLQRITLYSAINYDVKHLGSLCSPAGNSLASTSPRPGPVTLLLSLARLWLTVCSLCLVPRRPGPRQEREKVRSPA